MKSDRVFGLVMIFVALAYIASAFQIQASFLSDPVGSKTFPIVIGAICILCGGVIFLFPETEPDWPDMLTLGRIVTAVVVLILYSYALKPLGFIIPTALAAAFLSWQIRPVFLGAVLAGVGLSVGLFVIFKYGLGLGLVGLPNLAGL